MYRYDVLSQVLGANLVTIHGEFEPNGASAVNNALNVSGRGVGAMCGFTVVRISAGLYEVTLGEPVAALVNVQVTGTNLGALALGGLEGVNVAGPNNVPAGIGMSNLGRSFRIRAKDNSGAAADITQAAGRKIQFTFTGKTKTY